ncbi:hypothetical protein CYMTET_43772 [Cymbomonas tetramitiformis]|uniref:DUF111 family protein n=1 Tax=Cymbomonas tetramitiformis TaxID=36881 RepID=A0AAE0F1B7_9CHLO|nr:hypothetical protein CYMTET_43772 [Cymbomonas tetramitiformis]
MGGNEPRCFSSLSTLALSGRALATSGMAEDIGEGRESEQHRHSHTEHHHHHQELEWIPRGGPLMRGCGRNMYTRQHLLRANPENFFRVLFIDAYCAGVAGDMLVASLLDLGVPFEVVRDAVAALPFEGYVIRIEGTERSGIVAPR